MQRRARTHVLRVSEPVSARPHLGRRVLRRVEQIVLDCATQAHVLRMIRVLAMGRCAEHGKARPQHAGMTPMPRTGAELGLESHSLL